MKIISYISISILLVVGCAGRTEKIKGELPKEPEQDEVFEPAYPKLIGMYNGGLIDEFYSELDTIRINKLSSIIRRRNSYPNPFSRPMYDLQILIKITEDSSLVSILILNVEEELLCIEYNGILRNGDYIYNNNIPYIESGVYYYLLKIGTEESLKGLILVN